MNHAATIIRQARRLGGVSQAELSRKTGIAQPTISAYERGVHEPSFNAVRVLVEGAGLELDLRLLPRDRSRGLPDTLVGRLLRDKRSELIETAKCHGAGNLRVFGSVARGEDGPKSDVDLLIDLAPGTGLVGLGVIEEELEAVLGRKIDLVPASSLRADLRDSVDSEAIPIETQ